ncbi:MAG: hypothetical protein K2J30_01865 [Clostridia bacterium]|nr:hypothetical protein [Clostridia bacterium]
MRLKQRKYFGAIRLIAVALLAWICGMPATQSAHADTGPKPSVIVTVENLDGKVCYGTLLSDDISLGPTSAYSPEHPYIPSKFDPTSENYSAEEHAIWKAFVEYADPDGYYYQQVHWACHETGKISWTYYPPSPFKILLYFPETQTFVSSGIYESYAFHSYFSATLSDTDFTVSQTASLDVRKNYDYTWEIVSLIVRIVVTILIELFVAWLFNLHTKTQILSVTIVNVVTQTALNVALNILSFFQSTWALIWYIPLELAVFVIEAVAYTVILNLLQPKTVGANGDIKNPDHLSIGKCVLFSLVANILSFAAGFALVKVIPGVF